MPNDTPSLLPPHPDRPGRYWLKTNDGGPVYPQKRNPASAFQQSRGSICPAPCVAVTAAGSLPGKQQRHTLAKRRHRFPFHLTK
jgi:hypothetical protein